MTVITAVRKNGKYAMSTDSMHSSCQTKVLDVEDNLKMIRQENNFIGFAGAAINRLAFTEALKEIETCFDSVSDIYSSMLKIHQVFKEKHFLTSQSTHEEPFEDNDLCVLICNANGIFCVGSDRSVLRHESYWSIGSGMHFALGSMCNDKSEECFEIAKNGVLAACRHSDSCMGPDNTWHR